MKLTAFGIILFFVSLNCSLYFMSASGVIGDIAMPAYGTPASITNMFTPSVLLSTGAIAGVGLLLSYLANNLIYGGSIAIFLAVISMLIEPARWVLFGFPMFLNQIMTPAFATSAAGAGLIAVINALMAVVWFWFILGFLSQRTLET